MSSADDVIEAVQTMLKTRAGRAQSKRVVKYLRALVALGADHRAPRTVMREREGSVLFATVGKLLQTPPRLDVRIQGRLVGEVRLQTDGVRSFEPVRPWKRGWPSGPTDWAEARVRQYLEDREKELPAKDPEAKVQSALFVAMRETRGLRKLAALHRHQPVQMLGLPFQFPLPVSASGKSPKVSEDNALGHADVLARHGSGHRLRVFEIKKPGGDARHALQQGVAYAAALEKLLRLDRKTLLQSLGFSVKRKGKLKMEVWAFVHVDDKAKVLRNAQELKARCTRYPLHAMLYRMSGSRLLEVEELPEL